MEPQDLPAPAAKPPRPKTPRWIIQVRQLDLGELAGALGIQFEDDRLRPCPRCGLEGGAEVFRNRSGWLLWRCEACEITDRGNLDLASFALTGQKAGDLDPERKALLRQWFADQGWCDAADGNVEG